jgi:hypothetical protein
MAALAVISALVTLLLAVLVAGLLRSHADILRALHELGIGDDRLGGQGAPGGAAGPDVRTDVPEVQDGVVAPGPGGAAVADVAGEVPGGGQRVVTVAGADHTTLLAFLSTGCATCAEFWQAFALPDAGTLPGASTRLVIVTKDASEESPSLVASLAPAGVTTIMSSAAWDRYRVPGSPYFVLVDGPSGTIVGEGSGTSWPQVSGLLSSAMADAGWTADRARGRQARAGGREREARADRELLDAGIQPGDDSLYPSTLPQVEGGAVEAGTEAPR